MTAPGKSVRMFLVDGTPGGLVTAEIMNWTGHILAGSRSDLPEVLKRDETHRTGTYLLLGDSPESTGAVKLYVGEGDDIGTRLSSHAREKDFWQRAILITSKDANLTKAHARYLESRFIELAHAARRSEITNETRPPRIQLPEADLSDMEYFISQVLIALPVLGVNVFRARRVELEQVAASTARAQVEPRFTISRPDRVAHAVESDGEFLVLEGSQAKRTHTGAGSYAELRRRLERDGTIDASQDPAVFTKDQAFASPSAAAGVVLGNSVNGRTAWVEDDSGKSYGDWQYSRVAAAESLEG